MLCFGYMQVRNITCRTNAPGARLPTPNAQRPTPRRTVRQPAFFRAVSRSIYSYSTTRTVKICHLLQPSVPAQRLNYGPSHSYPPKYLGDNSTLLGYISYQDVLSVNAFDSFYDNRRISSTVNKLRCYVNKFHINCPIR